MNEADQLARQRLIVMNVVRLSGVILAMIGLAGIAEKLPIGREIGAFLFIFGMFEALFMPAVLAKRWKSPRF
jgi:superfamily II RNA helicase